MPARPTTGPTGRLDANRPVRPGERLQGPAADARIDAFVAFCGRQGLTLVTPAEHWTGGRQVAGTEAQGFNVQLAFAVFPPHTSSALMDQALFGVSIPYPIRNEDVGLAIDCGGPIGPRCGTPEAADARAKAAIATAKLLGQYAPDPK